MRLRDAWMTRQGGVVRRCTLLSWGNDQRDLRLAVESGGLVRVRHGWYAIPTADAQVRLAVGAGGSLSCLTVLQRRGVWCPTIPGIHVRPAHPRTAKAGSGLRMCHPLHPVPVGVKAVDDLDTALLCAATCCDDEGFLVVLDSVVNLKVRSRYELGRLFAGAPRRVRRILARMDTAESGTETMVRARLRRHRVRLTPQVQIGDVGRVDFLIGTSLVIEVDSKTYHMDPEAYEKDRERDRRLRALGYTVIRLTYDQVVNRWAEVEPDLLHMVRRGDHLRPVEAAA